MASISRSIRRSRGKVVSLADVRKEAALALADVARPYSAPEQGQRTPRPRIDRWTRARFNDVELSRVTSILRRAEDGDTVELADLWLRMLKTDAHLESVWESRTAPVYSARWEITPAEVEEARVPLAQAAARASHEALANLDDLPTLFSALLNARGVGFTVAELCWKRGRILGRDGWTFGAIKPVHSRRFRFSDFFEIGLYDDGRAVSDLRAAGWRVDTIPSRGSELARLPAGKYVVHQPVGIHDYPTATGLVHSLARWWWVKQVVTKYWLSGAEIGGNPRIIGKILQNAVGVTVDELHQNLEELSGDGVTVLREGADVVIEDAKAKSSSDVWDTLFRRMDLAMSKAVLGSTLNVEVDSSGGNRAAAESQDAVTIRPRQQQDAAQMWATLRRDALRWLVKYNPHIFPADTPLPHGRSVLVEEVTTIDQLAVDSGKVRTDELRASRGLPLIGGEEGRRFIAPITRAADEATTPAPGGPEAPAEEEERAAPVDSAENAQPEPAQPQDAPEELDVAPGEDVQAAALNGAQVASMLEIVRAASIGEITRESAIAIITSSFPVAPEQAARIVPHQRQGAPVSSDPSPS